MAIRKKDVDSAFKRYSVALEMMEFAPRKGCVLAMIHGSPVDGTSFRLVWVNQTDGSHSSGPGVFEGYLGDTRREARRALIFMARAMEDAAYARVNGMEWA